jgi:hypothetical protein
VEHLLEEAWPFREEDSTLEGSAEASLTMVMTCELKLRQTGMVQPKKWSKDPPLPFLSVADGNAAPSQPLAMAVREELAIRDVCPVCTTRIESLPPEFAHTFRKGMCIFRQPQGHTLQQCCW